MRFFTLSRIFAAFILTAVVVCVHAQQGCPDINAPADINLPCGTNCANLTATYFETGGAATYSVSSIPYVPFSYTAGTAVIVNDDDIWSTVIDLPFTFCYFDQPYTQLVIGANGLISFDVANAGMTCNWGLNAATNAIPTPNTYSNSIMGPYHDIDPSLGGSIRYLISGTAPCRTFVVSYNDVPMFDSNDPLSNCSSTNDATHQIVLYETTNAIEMYIENKQACTDWNGGLAIMGIQNAGGSSGYAVPGRNCTVWDAQNEGWRFTPTGTSMVTVEWLQGGSVVGTGASYQACPSTSPTTYTARATYLPCAGGTPVVVTDDVVVSLAGTLNAGIDSSRNVSCNGGSNGAVYAHVTGGSAPVNYGWNDGNSSLTRTNLTPGTYILTVSDASGCTRADTVIVTQPAPMNVSVADVTQTNCSGTGSGTLTAVVNGGFAPYSFVWNSIPVQNDSILDNVSAGTYTVTVTSSGGCTATDAGTLTVNTGGNTVTVSPPTITDVSCNGGNDGSITANATGGSGTFSYVWSNGQNSATASALAMGSYTVTINDGAGCTATATYQVAEPTPLIINTPLITNIGCGGNLTGSITADASGGTPAYNYNWTQQSNSQSHIGQTIAGLAADTYVLTVTDGNNCTATATYSVTAVPQLTFTQSFTNATCNGATDGSATINITTGTVPYSYDWNGTGATSNSTTSTGAGIVNVTVTDVNCTVTATFTISEPSAVMVSQVSLTNVSCFAGNNGSVVVAGSGGSPGAAGDGYTYSWSNGQATETASALTAGTVMVTVTDGNSCTGTASFTLTEPPQLTGNASATNTSCFQTPDGTINCNPSGGTVPYTFLWSDAQISQTATNLVAGVYSCVITDANGCTVNTVGQVGEPSEVLVSGIATQVSCAGANDGSITPSASGGTAPYAFIASQSGTSYPEANGVINGLPIGSYILQVTDANGCMNTAQVVVPGAEPDLFITTTDSTSCYGAEYSDGAAHIVGAAIQNGPYQFSINEGNWQYSGDFFNLPAGTHTIRAVNYFGCESTITVIVEQPQPVLASINPDSLTISLGEGTQVTATYQNANNATFMWTPSEGLSCVDCSNPVVSPFVNSDFVVTVSVVNGSSVCSATAGLHVEVEPRKPVYIPNTFSPNGDGNNDVFLVYGEDIKTVDLKIFNRWGELVYKTNNVFAGWDGTYKGQLQNPSVFTYTARITFLNNKEFEQNGSITLLR